MTTIDTGASSDEDRALKAKHRALWALGDYPRIATEVVAPLGPELVEAAGIERGDAVLDVGAGTGNAAIPAAAAGARVTASDLTPELLDAGRQRTGSSGIEWIEADAEALPFAAASFDVVLSCIGVMFAPHHQHAADELLRVFRPNGTIALISWTPEGFIGRLFAAMRPFAPAPPPGAQPPPLWGSPDHLAALFGARVHTVVSERRMLSVTRFASPEQFRDYFRAHYGPTIAVYRFLAGDTARIDRLDDALVALGREHAVAGDGFALEWEYLVSVLRRT